MDPKAVIAAPIVVWEPRGAFKTGAMPPGHLELLALEGLLPGEQVRDRNFGRGQNSGHFYAPPVDPALESTRIPPCLFPRALYAGGTTTRTMKQLFRYRLTRPLLTGVLIANMVSLVLVASAAETAKKQSPSKATKPNPAYEEIQDVPGLPRVLLLGDSISIGYTLPVRALLKVKANVHRPPENCASTRAGLRDLDKWLGTGKWDVIHFNWGLHDLKYVDENGQLADKAKGKQFVPLEEYEKNLTTLVERLQKTGATLIWCSSTPVPEGTQGRVAGEETRYNEVALKIMKQKGVAVDDLWAFAKPRLAKIQLPANAHYSSEGSQELAKQVASEIEKALPKRK